MGKAYQICFFFALSTLYGLFFYFILTYQFKLDFSSLYESSSAFIKGLNPYIVQLTSFLPVAKKLPANLNPPFVLLLFSPLTFLSYKTALLLWVIFTFLAGLIGAVLAFYYSFSLSFFKKNSVNLLLLYLAFFPTLMNTAVGQFGFLLLFLSMLGYHFFLKQKHLTAGVLWGILTAIKLFPALLIFYILKARRYKVFLSLLGTVCLSFFLPLFFYGSAIYSQYLTMLAQVNWYGDSWNASLYGLLVRVFQLDTSSFLAKAVFIASFISLLILYLSKLKPSKKSMKLFSKRTAMCELRKGTATAPTKQSINHRPFCLTLTMMLVMSPFGWLYYFPLLVLPLTLIIAAPLTQGTISNIKIFLTFLCLFFVNFPIDYVSSEKLSLGFRLSFASFHCYGLLLLTYLIAGKKKMCSYSTLELEPKAQANYQFILSGLFILPAIVCLTRTIYVFFNY